MNLHSTCVCMSFITLTQHLHGMCVAHIKTRSLHLTIYSLVTVYNYGPTTFKELDIRSSLAGNKKNNPLGLLLGLDINLHKKITRIVPTHTYIHAHTATIATVYMMY